MVLATLIFYKIFFSVEKTPDAGVFVNSAQPNGDAGGGESGEKKEARLSLISEKSVKGPKVSEKSAEIIYYENQNFISSNFDGSTKKSIGAHPFSKVNSVQWHPKKNKALVNDSGKFFIYNLDENTANEIKTADVVFWDTYGERIVYKYYDIETKKRRIAMADENGNNEEILADEVPYTRVDFLAIPKSEKICYFPSPESNTEGILNCIDLRSKNKTTIGAGLYGADYLWSPNGKKILVSYLSEKGSNKISLATMNQTGGEFKGINFASSAKKCVWTNDSKGIFCGSFTGLPEYAVLPNDWEQKKYYSADTFWKVEVESGKRQRIVDLEELPAKLDAVEFVKDSNEKNLFFVDRQSGNLYRIRF